MQVSVTGIKPSGTPHLGNYLGMIRPALALVERTDAVYFVADYHAMTTTRDPVVLRTQSREVAATWLALGFDADRVGALPAIGPPRGLRARLDPLVCHAEGIAEPGARVQGSGAGQRAEPGATTTPA